MSFIKQYLNGTTIHGLRYLAEARSPLIRLLWLLCIAACFWGSVTIIYFNIRNWENSPTVVTTVMHSLVKGKPLMPMVTVCPDYPNTNNLLYNLLKRDESCAGEDLVAQLTRVMAADSIKRYIGTRRMKGDFDMAKAKDMFLACEEEEVRQKSEEECGLVLLLATIAKGMLRGDIADGDSLLFEFIVDKTVAKEIPTLKDLKGYVEDRSSAKLEDYEHTELRLFWVETVELYTYFFPEFKFRKNENLDALRQIDQFEFLEIFRIGNGDLADLLVHMIDRGVMLHDQDRRKITAKILYRCMTSHLGVENHDYIHFLMSAFNFYFGSSSRDSHGYPCGGKQGNSSYLGKRCLNPVTEECRNYCTMAKLTNEQKIKMRDLFVMGLGNVGPINSSNPVSLLPNCRFPEEGYTSQCWQPSLTDMGACFSTIMNEERSMVKGAHEYAATEFAVDFGSSFDFYESISGGDRFSSSNLLSLMITPPGHYSVSPLVERKNAVFFIHPELFANLIMWELQVELEYITSTTTEFRALSPEKRNCFYKDENQLRLFPSYSETNCFLECSWEYAVRECNCSPWFLLDTFPSKDLCEIYGNMCFTKVVNQRHEGNIPCKHRCLPDCEKMDYSTKVHSVERTNYYSWEDSFRAPPLLDQVRQIKVYINKRTTLEVVSTATVTIIDMISNIGGTLGLFSGFSILSGVELLYWAGKAVNRAAKRSVQTKTNL